MMHLKFLRLIYKVILYEFILNERGRELLGETNRWEDLVRCELLYDWVKKYNPDAIYIKPYHKLRPIPPENTSTSESCW